MWEYFMKWLLTQAYFISKTENFWFEILKIELGTSHVRQALYHSPVLSFRRQGPS